MPDNYKLVWDKTGERFYETGVKMGVLYPYDSTLVDDVPVGYKPGVAWNGLTAVTESPSGAEESPIYADDIKYLSLRSKEELGATIEAYTYPDAWAACDGSAVVSVTSGSSTTDTGIRVGQQIRKKFGLCFRTSLGNDVDGDDHGYKLHLLYGCTASPSERAYQTINDSPEAITFSWEVTTVPETMPDGLKPAASITIDSTKADPTKLAALEAKLYGTAGNPGTDPYLPLPAEVFSTLKGSVVSG